MLAGIFRASRSSFTSFPRRVSPPMIAMEVRGPVRCVWAILIQSLALVQSLGTSLMLRERRWRLRPELAANNTRDSNYDAGADIERRQRQQDRLRIVRNQYNERAKQDDGERRARSAEVHLLEAGIAPGADHQECEQGQHA